MDPFLRDLVMAVRLLRRRAGFSALAIAVLAIAIGANSAIFSVVEGVLLRAPAFEEPERLVAVWERGPVRTSDRNVVGPYNYSRWRERWAWFCSDHGPKSVLLSRSAATRLCAATTECRSLGKEYVRCRTDIRAQGQV